MKALKILLISSEYPFNGGQSTTFYNLSKILSKNGFLCKSIFIIRPTSIKPSLEFDQKIETIKIENRRLNFVRKWLHKSDIIKNINIDTKSRTLFFLIKIYPKLIYKLVFHKFIPDIVVTNVPSHFGWVRFLPGIKIFVVGSLSEMIYLSSQGVDAQTFIENPNGFVINNKGIPLNKIKRNRVIFNSPLTAKIKGLLDNCDYSKNYLYFNIFTKNSNNFRKIEDRDFDLGFIASDSLRLVKNAEFAKNVFAQFPQSKKIVCGKNFSKFDFDENTVLLEPTTQEEIAKILSNTKLLIITSFFDSSPSVLSESISNGCNVLISKNVGWHELIPETCVISDFDNLDEWISKINFLCNNQIQYKEFRDIINNSEKEIIKWFNSHFT
jgi:hypothetical protein